MVEQTRAKNDLAAPLGIRFRQNIHQHYVTITISMPPGMDRCHLQITETPAEEASWRTLKGDGLRRKFTDIDPGTHWLRACSVVADDWSAWCEPVMLVMK